MPYFTNAMMLWTWPMQASAAFWSAYLQNLSRMAGTAMPPGAAEATGAAAAGAAAVTKGRRGFIDTSDEDDSEVDAKAKDARTAV